MKGYIGYNSWKMANKNYYREDSASTCEKPIYLF